jgi:hypothetical protein
MMEDTRQYPLRTPPELFSRIAERARVNHRSVNGELIHLLITALSESN